MSHSRDKLKKQNRLSLLFGAPGMILQAVGGMSANLPSLIGSALLIVGLGFCAKMKGPHPALGVLGVLSIIGLLVLYFFPSKCQSCAHSQSYENATCEECGSPLKP